MASASDLAQVENPERDFTQCEPVGFKARRLERAGSFRLEPHLYLNLSGHQHRHLRQVLGLKFIFVLIVISIFVLVLAIIVIFVKPEA